MIDRFSIVTLVLFAISIYFVISPVSLPVPLSRRIFKRPLRLRIDLITAPFAAVCILWASGCIDSTVVRDGIVGTDGIKPYNILILFFSLAYMAVSLDLSGVLQAAAFWVSNKGGSNGWRLFLYFYLMLTAFSVVVGNDPVILSGTAFLVYYTKVAEVSHISWLFSEFAAANTASMVLFVGNPTNVVICEGFGIRNIAFSAYTIFPFIACSIVCYFALAVQFRHDKYIPKRLPEIGVLDPRSVLLDPTGAWVGSIILGACLVLIMGISFIDVDVWEISLPFAVAKFVFDIGWDLYRHSRGTLGAQATSAGTGKPGGAPEDLMRTQIERTKTETSHHHHPNPDDPLRAALERSHSEATQHHSALSSRPQSQRSQDSRRFGALRSWLDERIPTFMTALPRLPFALVPFAFCQFILVEALAFRGWIDVFARWLQRASHGGQPYPTIWLIGTLGVVLCNLSGTNIGATILLTKVLRAAELSKQATLAGAVALAVASNIGAVSFTFSASLAGLLWRAILKQKGITMSQRQFAQWNVLPVTVMTVAGLGVVCAEVAVIIRAGLAGVNDP
ncbi:hypothetical protein EXIGLDRAFT_675295 [Exidia glandulosa HHB12029]|uniref:Citrate transporter-like domain-containing protein n=1 Tax=Exidia glandulosa HHB12029 TaxID=1314781 RepID=A0A165HPU4_EXIGL|nr:hypothetical protein EXIGLDRAFT_675295 [Exidia glandulosa HHB12029]